VTTWWRRRYGSSPLHLLALIACFALSAYAALQVSGNPAVVRIGLWFLGAVIAHDLVLFPLYALADRCLTGLRGRRPATPARGTVNYLRVPALLSGLLLLVFFPLILRRGDRPVRRGKRPGPGAVSPALVAHRGCAVPRLSCRPRRPDRSSGGDGRAAALRERSGGPRESLEGAAVDR